MTIDDIMRTAPVIPVLVVPEAKSAALIAEALVAGGLPVIEVTLRTPSSLDVIAAMAEVDGAIVGAGTVLSSSDLDGAQAAGAHFIVSPGLTEPLALAAQASGLPYLPGAVTAGDLMRGLDLGLDHFKFFPAIASGGLAMLRALTGPFQRARFCPTGGIRPDNAGEWLAEDAVLCVGGTWLVPEGPVDGARITANARAAASLR